MLKDGARFEASIARFPTNKRDHVKWVVTDSFPLLWSSASCGARPMDETAVTSGAVRDEYILPNIVVRHCLASSSTSIERHVFYNQRIV